MIWIALAALLWSTDTLFRFALVQTLPTPTLVLYEHILAVLVFLPAVWRNRTTFKKLGLRQWFELLWIGVGGSAVATLLFTEAFKTLNPTLIILLQKLQPVFALILASIVLGETRTRAFLGWAVLALLAAVGLQDSVQSVSDLTTFKSSALLPLGAALLWGASTVFSKSISGALPSDALAGSRLIVGALFLAAFHLFSPDLDVDRGLHLPLQDWLPYVVTMSLVSGSLALRFYYRGLRTTRASAATLLELLFPLSATILNAVILGFWLTPTQFVSAFVLLVAITQIAKLESKQK